jgi:hypothetical protein
LRWGSPQRAQVGEQVVGIAAGQVESDMKMDRAVLASSDGLKPLAQLLIACGRLDKLEVGGSGLQVGPQEAGMMPIA